MSKRLGAVCVLVLLAAGCGTATSSGAEPTTTIPQDTDTTAATAPCSPATDDACGPVETIPPGPLGDASVSVGEATFQFRATRCLINTDVFVVDGVSADRSTTIAMRHASPPTRPDPQPSMSYMHIQPEPQYESPPAAIGFDTYDPEAGTATGTVDQGVSFTVHCDR